MWIVTASQMQTLDRRTIQEAKIASTTLMERAGNGVVTHILRLWGDPKGKKAVVLCGKGNNGGDGLVVARLLQKKKAKIKVVLMAPYAELSPDAKIMYRRLSKVIRPSLFIINPSDHTLRTLLHDADLIVDALLGTGISSAIRPPYTGAITAINDSPAFTVAVDIPSGLDSTSGVQLGIAVHADVTITFGCPKVGFYVGAGIDLTGRIAVADIGIPATFVEDENTQIQLLSHDLIHSLIPLRKPSSHKGTFGHAGIVAGSPGKTGAPALSAMGALRVGTGLVTVAIPQSLSPVLESKLLEVMTEPVPEEPSHRLGLQAFSALMAFAAKKSALAFGPGMGDAPETTELLQQLLPQLDIPCVLDADALNALTTRRQVFQMMKTPPILTPHPGEMARLLGSSTPRQVNEDRVGTARQFARQYRVVLVLKGARTVIAHPEGLVAICPTGNPGMASAGTGDVLTGMIAGLLAQGLQPWEAARAGVYLHGLAGDLAAAEIGEAGLIAGDIIKAIPQALAKTLSP